MISMTDTANNAVKLILVSSTLILGLLILPSTHTSLPVSAQETGAEKAGGTEKNPGRYIVVLKDGVGDSRSVSKGTQGADATGTWTAAESIAKKYRLELEHVFVHALKGFSAKIPAAAVPKLKADPRVGFVEQDRVIEAADTGQVIPKGITRIDAAATRIGAAGVGDVSTGIAIVDTGIDLAHPDLNAINGKTCVPGTKDANDDNGHGTLVAGTAAAKNNAIGVLGVAPNAPLYAVKVLGKNGSGYMSWVICGLDWVTQHASTVKVANLSFGCKCHSSALRIAVQNSVGAGVTFVVAAMNSASDAKNFDPASYSLTIPGVLTVSAIVDTDGKCGGLGPSTSYGMDDTLASFSNFGEAVNIAAPGVAILSTSKGGGYGTASGTSISAPHVTGAAATYIDSHPGALPSNVRDALISSAVRQDSVCDTSLNDGNGGFTKDRDTFPEPLVNVINLRSVP